MQSSETPPEKSTRIFQKSFDKSKIKIHNILPNIERTFLQIGSTIGKYQIIEEIDRGGMAVVYKALQLDLDRHIALKVLPANITINRRFVDRFLSEAHAVAKLQHPNIVNIHEVAVENNVYYLAMDYIPGMNLYYHLNFRKPKLVEVLEITAKLADALAYAHNLKIIHRDLKLNNIIMKDNITPVLIDFGLAKALEGEDVALTKTGEIMGSPAYMAPERLAGSNTDARSDICSLGIMLYEMLTFKNPYLDPRSMPQTTMNVVEANPILPRKLVPWLPVEIEAITLKAMQKEPENRYQSMEEFAADIRRYQRGEQVLANPPSLWSKGKRLIQVHWSVFIIVSLVCLFSSLYVFTFYYQNKKDQPYWQLIYQLGKNPPEGEKEWSVSIGGDTQSDGKWGIKNLSIYSPAGGHSFIKLRRDFSHDVRVEFDIKARSEDFAEIGFFLDGCCPDSGYCFHVHHGARGLCGISYPGSDFLFADYNPVELVSGRRYHVFIEKKDHAYSFKLNNVTIGTIWDFFPLTGKNHRQLGFFVDGTPCEISDLKIFGYIVPHASELETPADRIAQRGETEVAYEEYLELLPEISSDDAARDVRLKMVECLIRLGDFDKATALAGKISVSDKHDDTRNAQRLYMMGVLQSLMGKEDEANDFFTQLFKTAPENPLSVSAGNRMVLRCVNYLKNSDPDAAEKAMSAVRANVSEPSKNSGKLYLMIVDYYLAKGFLDKAKATADNIISGFKNEPDIVLMARVLLSRVYLAKGDKTMATDLLNQCVASYVPSEAAWQAWLELAEIYEYDANWSDAFTIYRKIFDDCPKYLYFPWMARVKMGEIADRVTSEEKRANIFNGVITSPHPFALPRLLARFYVDSCSKEDFKKSWVALNPGNREYLCYYAKKAIMEKSPDLARWYLKEFKRDLPPNIWPAQRTNKAISLLEK